MAEGPLVTLKCQLCLMRRLSKKTKFVNLFEVQSLCLRLIVVWHHSVGFFFRVQKKTIGNQMVENKSESMKSVVIDPF